MRDSVLALGDVWGGESKGGVEGGETGQDWASHFAQA